MNLIQTWISDPYPSDIGPDAQALIDDIEAFKQQDPFTAFAKIHPFLASHPPAASLNESSKDVDNISWSGPRGLVQEIVRISRRKAIDDGWPWPDEKGEDLRRQEEHEMSDDEFFPLSTWPAPDGVTSEEVFGDEEDIIKNRVRRMTELPIMEDELYTDDEELIV